MEFATHQPMNRDAKKFQAFLLMLIIGSVCFWLFSGCASSSAPAPKPVPPQTHYKANLINAVIGSNIKPSTDKPKKDTEHIEVCYDKQIYHFQRRSLYGGRTLPIKKEFESAREIRKMAKSSNFISGEVYKVNDRTMEQDKNVNDINNFENNNNTKTIPSS